MSDTHHFKETVNGGMLGLSGANNTGTGVWVMQLTDFPVFQNFRTAFEFVRLNSCTIEYIPKFNMQLVQMPTTNTGAIGSISITGTLVTAIDQVPFNVIIGTTAPSSNWTNDSSNTTGTTVPTPYSSSTMTVGYVRGLQNSSEKEFYMKRRQRFMPTFFTPVLGGDGTGTFTPVAWQRNVKKWVTTTIQTTGGAGEVINGNGPVYYGPVYAFDANYVAPATGGNVTEMYDIRLHYSMSFRRVKGV